MNRIFGGAGPFPSPLSPQEQANKTNRKKNKYDSRLLRPAKSIDYNAKQNDPVDKIYKNAGWHFSFMGDVQSKLRSWGHAKEYDKPPYNTAEHIANCKKSGADLFNRNLKFQFTRNLDFLPAYVLKNKETFGDYIR